MATTMKADPAHREGQLLYCALLPVFLAAGGARRILAHLKSNDPGQAAIRRNLDRRGPVANMRRDVVRLDGEIDVAVIRAASPPERLS